MTLNDPVDSIFPGFTRNSEQKFIAAADTEWGKCGCWTCVSKVVAASEHPWSMPFIVCPLCGNKRCPKATYHEYECTNSNLPGQKGSRY